MRLIFVRHGEPDYANDCLTENGRKQAECTAARLHDEKITAIYASPMGRAVETASYTAKDHGLDIRILDFMHEINWGDRDSVTGTDEKVPNGGHPWTLAYRMLTEDPSYVGADEWREHPYFRDNSCIDCYKTVAEGFDGFLDSLGFVRKNGLYECVGANDDTIALFAHGGSGAVMFSHVLNLPFPFALTTLPYGVCSVSVLDFSAQNGELVVPRLELFNDMGHISTIKQEKLHFDK